MKEGRPRRGRLLLCLALLFVLYSFPLHSELSDPNTTPDQWLQWILKIQEIPKKIQMNVFAGVGPENIRKIKYRDSVYTHTASFETTAGDYEVDWDEKKSGPLPTPSGMEVRASLAGENYIQHYKAIFNEMIIFEKPYFKIELSFAVSEKNGLPFQRGFATFFKDASSGWTKVSVSVIEGSADILPEEMTQVNLQTTFGDNGLILLREDQSSPLDVPDEDEQKFFCKNEVGVWTDVAFCSDLDDGGKFHGFSLRSIPVDYTTFLLSPRH